MNWVLKIRNRRFSGSKMEFIDLTPLVLHLNIPDTALLSLLSGIGSNVQH